jgi:hypothetical protein
MKKTILSLILLGFYFQIHAQNVFLIFDKKVPQIAYAARKLSESLQKKGYIITDDDNKAEHLINLAIIDLKLKTEAFEISTSNK